MHIDLVPNHGSRPTPLLRETYREGNKVRKRTVANLSKLNDAQIEAFRLILKGVDLAPVKDNTFEVVGSRLHGHVQAVRTTMQRLSFDKLIDSRRSAQRDRVLAMIAARILEPESSKLETTRWWHTTTLPSLLGVQDADEDDLYEAMDWLLTKQDAIENRLAKRHLNDGGLVLYDLTSSYFEGHTCPLAKRGHNRDGKHGKLQVNYGVLTDDRGRPVSVSVFEGNTSDPKTLLPQVSKLRDRFGLRYMALVGDRGMITQKQIDALEDLEGMHWITALRTEGIRKLVQGGELQLGLFDERNLFELRHEDYPKERLVACRNPELARRRAETRRSLLAATERQLDKVQRMVASGKLSGKDEIGVRVGRVINKYKVAKHIDLTIEESAFSYAVNEERVAAEAALDGIYVIRTSLPDDVVDADDAVRYYKSLSQIERGFRTMKGIDLKVRPIRHHLENRVRAHIFLCMLAYYVQWHMMQAWKPLLFADEDQAAKQTRDPVAPAERSDDALRKVHSRRLDDGSAVHSFHSLLQLMQTIVRNTCHRREAGQDEPTIEIEIDTRPDEKQQRALDLLAKVEVYPRR
jgi:transposase